MFFSELRNYSPHFISFLRLVSGPYLLWLGMNPWVGFWVVAACFSDFLDGFLARRLGVSSEVGKILDSLADKIFVLCVTILLVKEDRLSKNIFMLMALRDLSLAAAAGFDILRHHKWDQGPLFSGKIYITVAMVLVVISFFDVMSVFQPAAIGATLITGLFSWASYVRRAFLTRYKDKA